MLMLSLTLMLAARLRRCDYTRIITPGMSSHTSHMLLPAASAATPRRSCYLFIFDDARFAFSLRVYYADAYMRC